MGSPKALLQLGGETFADLLAGRFAAFCQSVVVVAGAHYPEIRAGMRRRDVILVENPEYRLGQITSMQCGLRALAGGIEGVLFTLVDHPNVAAATLARLIAAGGPIAIPRFQGRRGHPIFFSGELIPEFLAVSPRSSAREVLDRHDAEIRYVDVDDGGILDDIDTPEAYRRLAEASP